MRSFPLLRMKISESYLQHLFRVRLWLYTTFPVLNRGWDICKSWKYWTMTTKPLTFNWETKLYFHNKWKFLINRLRLPFADSLCVLNILLSFVIFISLLWHKDQNLFLGALRTYRIWASLQIRWFDTKDVFRHRFLSLIFGFYGLPAFQNKLSKMHVLC